MMCVWHPYLKIHIFYKELLFDQPVLKPFNILYIFEILMLKTET